jgi:hypothetical protein
MLRITLQNTKYGQFTIEKNDPVGINELVLNIKRSNKNDGVFFEVIINLKFIKEAIPYIRNCFNNGGGIDALVLVTVYEYDPNSRIWEVYQQGKINFNMYNRNNDTIEVAIEQVTDQTLILNNFEADIDLENTVADDGTTISAVGSKLVNLHSNKILALYQRVGASNVVYNTGPATMYVLFGTEEGGFVGGDYSLFIDEINERITGYPMQVNTTSPVTERKYLFKMKDAGSNTLAMHMRFAIIDLSSTNRDWNIQWKLAYGSLSAGYTTIDIGANYIHAAAHIVSDIITVNETFDTLVGDEVYIYGVVTMATGGAQNISFAVSSEDLPNALYMMRLDSLTTFQESICKGVLLFEAVQQCLWYYTGGRAQLRSTLLGRTDLGYDEDGDASLILWTNGNQIRGLSDKKIFTSLDAIIKFLNSVFCVSYGFETEANVLYLRVERKEYFYDNATQISLLSGQFDFNENLKKDMFYKQVTYGYNVKIDLKQVNGKDAFNTLRKLTSPIANTKNPLDISTNINANGIQIEYMRRLVDATQDSPLNDQLFAIVVKRSGGDYVSKQDDGYDSITGVYDAASGYNYDISPSRMIRNWFKFLASTTIYSKSKIYKFASGEGNYEMVSTKTGEEAIAENGDIDLTDEVPIFEPFEYILNDVPFNRSQVALTKATPFGYYSFRDKENVLRHGFIDGTGIDHDSNKGVAGISLLKAYKVV